MAMLDRALLALVLLAAAASVLAGSQTRTSGFDYDPATGLLVKEIIEPDDPNLCLVTTYTYDAFGNKASATTRNCNGSPYGAGVYAEAAAPTGNAVFTPRTSSSTYAAGSVVAGGTTFNYPAGQFATSSTNALTQSETRNFDPRFGAAVSLTGPNGLTTTWSYDGFGRKTTEARADGTSTTWAINLCGTCPAGGTYSVAVTATGAPNSTTYYDTLNRAFRTEVQGFDGTLVRKDTQFDSLGRVSQVSRPYYSTATPVYTVFTYDILGRVLTQTEPNNAVTTSTYNGLTTSVTNALNQTETRIKNSQGQFVQVNRQ
jgi:YD repeat-containing protein